MLEHFEALLLQASRSSAIDEGRLDDAYRLCLEMVRAGLGVARAGIWEYLPDRSGIRCVRLIDDASGAEVEGLILTRDTYPHYFSALDTERAIVADDACEHPSTSEFKVGYLVPLGITSMLDVPIRHRGAMVGIVCCEHVGPARRWRAEEASFAASIADLIGRAITANAQVQTELALREVNATLEERIQERTQALADALLAAEAANRAKSRFLATMSHELRTPLTAIMGYADLLLEDVDATQPIGEALADVGAIRGSAIHLLALIDDVLDLARVEAGVLPIAPVRFDPRPLVDSVVAVIRPQAEARGNALRVDLDGGPEGITADPRRVRQILVNLVGNAVKFTEAGTITLRVEARERAGAAVIAFEVRDTGVGVAPEHLARLFERFFQVDTGPSRQISGSGLGLAISKSLAEAMGGEITVESELGRGSLFTLLLPG
ncbi:MAG: ATP-binding protein [Nannocystaceae bacterium]